MKAQAEGIHVQLERIYEGMGQLQQSLREHQRATDARLVALDDFVRGLRDDPPSGSRQQNTIRTTTQSRKDSSANYLRVRPATYVLIKMF